MNLGIRGKVALVTASSAGMGRNIANALATEGVDVALFARSAEKLQQGAREIEQKYNVRALAVPGDMLVSADVTRLASLVKSFGGPDILVLNSGRPPNPIRATLDESDEERWHEAYRSQLWGTIQVANAVVPLMCCPTPHLLRYQ